MRHTFLAPKPLSIYYGLRSPDDSGSRGLSLREKALAARTDRSVPVKWLFNNREWPSFALAAENFLKMVPKPLEASTCTGTQAQEWRRRAMNREERG